MTSPAPARLPIPDGWQLTVNLTQAGQRSNVVLGYLNIDDILPSQAQAQNVLQIAWNLLQPSCAATTICEGGTLRSLSATTQMVFELAPPTSPAGTSAGFTAVAAASTLIRWTTADGSRSGKGRTFVPGLSQSNVLDGGRNLVTSYVSATATRANLYAASNTPAWDAALTPAVLSFRQGKGSVLVGASVSSVIGIQRRRMR